MRNERRERGEVSICQRMSATLSTCIVDRSGHVARVTGRRTSGDIHDPLLTSEEEGRSSTAELSAQTTTALKHAANMWGYVCVGLQDYII